MHGRPVQAFPPGVWLALVQKAFELIQRAPVDVALEFDHTVEIDPLVIPPPGVKLGFGVRPQVEIAVATGQPQQIPDLFLSTIVTAPLTLDPR